MAWNLVDFGKLGAGELNSWRQVREADPSLDSPFFHPAFAAAVHAVFGDVQVATNDHQSQLWFPVQVCRRVARPAGWPAADFQGPVAAPSVRVDPLELVRATGLRALEFDNLPEQRTEFAPWVEERHPSPFVDTTGGLDAYLSRISKAGRDKMSRVRRKTNRAGRELGEVRLVWDAQDPDLLDRLIEIKRAQYANTGVLDYFAVPGRQELLHRLLKTRVDGFGGILSAVYAGQTLLAAHFGLRDGGVLHWWFPVFEPSHADLGPGWMLLRELIAMAPETGLTRIDLGRGEEDYKRLAMTGSVPVCVGEVPADVLRRRMRRMRRAALGGLKSSPLGPSLRAAKDRVMRARADRRSGGPRHPAA
ncbi:GNAT family N-acetyltransferase [Mycobacterium sp. ACS1612]|uniref:GNAT family N-acetyltransferase n=1 Tax=Mycobacterium sp. ACS1612 TaxID=1834117 RepID=UPI000B0865B7|nr:GNAT family N-acetyltransferase [Mycobacterium sp. ACS1612]